MPKMKFKKDVESIVAPVDPKSKKQKYLKDKVYNIMNNDVSGFIANGQAELVKEKKK